MASHRLSQDKVNRILKKRTHGRIKEIGPYHKLLQKTLFTCSKGHVWMAQPYTYLHTQIRFCPICHKIYCNYRFRRRLNIYLKNSHQSRLFVMKLYNRVHEKLPIKCLGCGTIFYKSANDINENIKHHCNICPTSVHLEISQRQQETKAEVQHKIDVVHDSTIKMIGYFRTVNDRTWFQCRNCGHKWYTKPCYILAGRGCAKCDSSRGEKYINYLLQYVYHFSEQHSRNKVPSNMHYVHGFYFHNTKNKRHRLHADFFINYEYHFIAIEFDGVQHVSLKHFYNKHMSYKKAYVIRKRRDYRKNKYCYKHNIIMLRIINFKNYRNNKQIFNLVNKELHNELSLVLLLFDKKPLQLHKVHQLSLF